MYSESAIMNAIHSSMVFRGHKPPIVEASAHGCGRKLAIVALDLELEPKKEKVELIPSRQ